MCEEEDERRRMSDRRVSCGLLRSSVVVLIGLTTATADAAGPTSGASRIDFGRDVAPIFAAHCVRCHGAGHQEGGLRLDVRDAAMKGGDSGAVIVPQVADKSELL